MQIDLDLKPLPSVIARFVSGHISTCDHHSVPVHLPKSRTVSLNGMDCAGYFDDNPLNFAVACGKGLRNWFPTFVHETCHMDQWLEQDSVWTRRIDGKIPSDIFDSWVGGEDIPSDVLREMTDALVSIELDCERRSADKIRKLDLPIKIDTYIRKSNAYIWSYRLMAETRDWDHSGLFEYPGVWRRMPKHFNNDYSILPPDIRQAFLDQMEQ